MLQKMPVDRINCEPFGEVTGYRFAGEASYGGLLAGVEHAAVLGHENSRRRGE